jgi:hypothetical protein
MKKIALLVAGSLFALSSLAEPIAEDQWAGTEVIKTPQVRGAVITSKVNHPWVNDKGVAIFYVEFKQFIPLGGYEAGMQELGIAAADCEKQMAKTVPLMRINKENEQPYQVLKYDEAVDKLDSAPFGKIRPNTIISAAVDFVCTNIAINKMNKEEAVKGDAI